MALYPQMKMVFSLTVSTATTQTRNSITAVCHWSQSTAALRLVPKLFTLVTALNSVPQRRSRRFIRAEGEVSNDEGGLVGRVGLVWCWISHR